MKNMSDELTTECRLVDARIAEILQSVDAAELGDDDQRLLEHIADCERCRDVRFEAEQCAELVAQSGQDYQHPADFEQRLLAALGDEGSNPNEPLAPPAEHAGDETADEEQFDDDAAKPSKPTRAEVASERNEHATGKVVPLLTRKHLSWLIGPLAVAAIAVLMMWSKQGPKVFETSNVASAWHGTIKQVQRGYGSDQGLKACPSAESAAEQCRALEPGAAVQVGELIRTDGLTRALLELADGSVVALNRATELSLNSEAERSARLVKGEIIADVHKEEGKVAILDVPQGKAVVVGTKFALHAQETSSGVDVSRGEVRLVDHQERSVSIRAGEGGRISESAPPTASSLTSLSESFEWGERAFVDEEQRAASTRGLGELRAKKPGEKNERTGAVSLTKHSVKVRIVDSLARTEVEEVFTNHTDEVLEGIFRFPLPADAKIERLALEVDGRMEEGAFVDRERAAAIWRGAIVNSQQRIAKPLQQQEIIWVPGPWKDPALLEWQRGGRFELRIFPIPKRGSRRIILAYTQTIKPSGKLRRYSYPLAHDPSGSTRVDDFRVDVQVRGHEGAVQVAGYDMNRVGDDDGVERLALEQKGFVPSGDLGLEFTLPDDKSELNIWGYRPERDADAAYVALALRPKLPRWETKHQRAYVLAVDVSRSMYGEQYRRATALTRRIIAEMDRSDAVMVLACHAECRPLLDGLVAPSPQVAEQVYAQLNRERPEGASDLVNTIEQAAKWSEQAAGRETRVVLIGDGAPTVGPVQPAFVRRAVNALLPNNTTVSAVTVGSDADLGALSAATQAGGGSVLLYAPGQSISEAAYDVLAATYGRSLRNAQLKLPDGLYDVAPKQIGSIPAGSEVVVVARMRDDRVQGKAILTGLVGDGEFEQDYDIEVVASSAQGNAFVPRLYAAAQIEELSRSSSAESRERIVELSKRFNVASRYTSLLVLESPAMFKAFGLENQRTVPLWTGEDDTHSTGVDGNQRFDADDALGDSLGSSGGLADLGSANSGFGLGAGAVAKSAPKPSAPRSRAPRASAPLEESADKEERWAPPPPRSAPKRKTRSRANCRPDDLMCLMRSAERDERPQPRWEGRRQWIPMRKVWERTGTISFPPAPLSAASGPELSRLEARVQDNPLSRDALKALYAGYMLAGDLDRADELAERWSDKDPMDADALTARADVAAQRGDRKLAIRILGSVVDVRPGEHKAQWRLARLHRWAGRAQQGCRHSSAVAQITTTDPKLLTEAVRCARDTGQERLADELLLSADDKTRLASERLLKSSKKDSDELSGDFRLEAEWDGAEHDLDLVIVHPDGFRVSWLGAPTRSVITATDVLSVHREGLALRGAKPGEYAIEVVRTDGSPGSVRGNVKLRVGKTTRDLPFVLDGERTRIASVKVAMKSRLVRF